MKYEDLLPREIWCEIISHCRLEDVPALSEAFGSLFNEATAWIIKDEDATNVLKVIGGIAKVPPYVGTDLTIGDTWSIVGGMKAFCARYEKVAWSDWLNRVFSDGHRGCNRDNWWTAFVLLSRDIGVGIQHMKAYIKTDPRIQLLATRDNPELVNNFNLGKLSRAEVKWLMEEYRCIQYMPSSFRGDLELMTHACSINVEAYCYVCEPANLDLDLAMTVSRTWTGTLKYFELNQDWDVMKQFLAVNPKVFVQCYKVIKDSEEFVEIVAEKDPEQIRWASKRILSNTSYLEQLYTRFPGVFCVMSEEFRGNPSNALRAVRSHPRMYTYCVGKTKEDPAVVEAAVTGDASLLSKVPARWRVDPDFIRRCLSGNTAFMTWLTTGQGSGEVMVTMLEEAFAPDTEYRDNDSY